MNLPADLAARVDAWRADDPDPGTVATLDRWVAEGRVDEIADAFDGTLAFGTAGLRGALGPGPNRMNRAVASRAAAGLGAYLAARGGGLVVIGHDARHLSAEMARDSAEILAGAGLDVVLSEGVVPTPLVPWAIGRLGAVAGIVVTASHNPPADNGYKVYLGDGSQIVPPADADIAAAIDAVGSVRALPRGTFAPWPASVVADYVERAGSVEGRPGLRWVHTALHGVGAATVRAVVERAGFDAPIEVAAQAEPDPDFPTVAFPNPEEPGALDLALDLAREQGADLVVANDPDADRCAVAVPDAADATGWRMLTGDQLGVLLADDALRRGVTGTFACSIVSSTLLGRVAAAQGQPSRQTLTGFKWIGRVPGLAFGYEEALGYCCDPDHVKDKDGVTALVRVLDLATRLRESGSSLLGRWAEICAEHGEHVTSQVSVRVADLALIADVMARLRATPPSTLGGEPVEVVDLARASQDLPPTDGVLLTGASVRCVVRPSGTEPKLKCYLQTTGTDAEGAMARLRDEVSGLVGLA